MKECPCGIADVDCEYHKPAKRVYKYDEVELYIDGVKIENPWGSAEHVEIEQTLKPQKFLFDGENWVIPNG